jgi:hypothetical protein
MSFIMVSEPIFIFAGLNFELVIFILLVSTGHIFEFLSKSKMAASSNSFAALDGLDMDAEEQALQSATDPYLKEKHAKALVRGEKPLKDPIVWVDLEMTGLDLANDTIMEIAVIVTDGKLNTAIEVCGNGNCTD